MEEFTNTLNNATVPPSDTPELPGVVGIITIIISKICAAIDSTKYGLRPRPIKINGGISQPTTQKSVVNNPAEKNAFFCLKLVGDKCWVGGTVKTWIAFDGKKAWFVCFVDDCYVKCKYTLHAFV